MEPFFPSLYTQGYTAALQDVLKTIEEVQDDLKRHKQKQNAKTYTKIVQCMLENRAILRENPDAFVRYNTQADDGKGGFEVYISKKGVYTPPDENTSLHE